MDPIYIIPHHIHRDLQENSSFTTQFASMDRNIQYVLANPEGPTPDNMQHVSVDTQQSSTGFSSDAKSRVSNLMARIPLLATASKLAERAASNAFYQHESSSEMLAIPSTTDDSLNDEFHKCMHHSSSSSYEEQHLTHSYHRHHSRSSTFSSRVRNMPLSPPCSRATSPPAPSTAVRRRTQKTKLSRKHIDAAIRLSQEAVEEERRGATDYALDCYLSAIEYLLNAIPTQDEHRKQALKKKIKDCMESLGLSESPTIIQIMPAPSSPQLAVTNGSSTLDSNGYAERIIALACALAVGIKQSRIPSMCAAVAGYSVRKAAELNTRYQIHEHIIEFAAHLLELLLDLDKHYHLHERASQAIYISYAAIGRAIVAWRQAEGYEIIQRKQAIEKAMMDKTE